MRSNLPLLAMVIWAFNVAMLSGCSTKAIVRPVSISPVLHNPGAPRSWPSVFPSFTSYGSTRIVPSSQVAALPKKIAALSTGHSESIQDLVQLLGLSAFRRNVSINMRWNHHFMYLDEDHILYMTIDCEHLDSEPFVTPWNARVIACKLMKNPDVTIIEKDMGEKKMLDDQRTGANKGAAGNAVGRLAVCGVKHSGDRAVTPQANRFAGMSRASAGSLAFKGLLKSAPPRARA